MQDPIDRKDLENETYALWQAASLAEKPMYEEALRNLLVQHGNAVMFKILRRSEPALVEDGVNRVLLNLKTFRNDTALFTTWAHAILVHVMYKQRRQDRYRKEVSFGELDNSPALSFIAPDEIGATDLLVSVAAILDAEEKQLFDLIALEGKTLHQAGKVLKVSRFTVARMWNAILGKLKNAFAK